jgi:Ion channel
MSRRRAHESGFFCSLVGQTHDRAFLVDRVSAWHLGPGMAVAALSIISWACGWNAYVSASAIVLCDLYLLFVLIEAAFRSGKERTVIEAVPQPKPRHFFEFPARTWSLLQVLFLVTITIFGFANMYVKGGDIRYQGPPTTVEQPESKAEVSTQIQQTNSTRMEDPVDALYYSVVTLSTVGYGDFVPASKDARLVVMWQLGTALLLLLGVFPLVVTRIGDF